MSMPATDYNQQLLCYLQNWRQLLEQWAAMAAGSPFMTGPPGGQFVPPTAPFMPFMQFMPPMPPVPMGQLAPPASPAPPAPADYAQQLLGYLQAWRQYLEQATGAMPGQTWTAPQPAAVPGNVGGTSSPARPPDVPNPPGDPTGSKGALQSDDHTSSGLLPPKVVPRAPSNVMQSQLTAKNSDPLATPFDGPGPDIVRMPFRMADPAALAARPGTSGPIPEAGARPEAGSAFLHTINSVEPSASPPIMPRSLFSAPGETHSP